MAKAGENKALRSSGKRFGLHTFFALAALAAVLCAACILLPRFSATGAARSAALTTVEPDATAVPTEVPTPAPTEGPTETPSVQTAVPTEAPTQAPSAFVKTSVYIDGRESVVLASRQAAEELINSAIAHFALLCPDAGAVTVAANNIEYVTADENAKTTSFDEAYAFMIGENSPLTVKSSFTRSELETVPHETVVTESDDFFEGTRFVASYGRDGKKTLIYEYTYVNGVLAYTVVREERVHAEPVTERIIIGTRPAPEHDTSDAHFNESDCPAAELTFRSPLRRGSICRYFGYYGGVLHRGIDFNCPAGTECYAACGGTVIAVLERGALGKTIDIAHGNGWVTRYALLGTADVALGSTVRAGQFIGSASDSGIHFEIILNGRPRNPIVYLTAPGGE